MFKYCSYVRTLDQIRPSPLHFPLHPAMPFVPASNVHYSRQSCFRSTDFQQRQTELVVIVTVHLVEPGSAQRLASPADTLVLPTDVELFGEGRTEGLTPIGQTNNLQPDNSTGFVLP